MDNYEIILSALGVNVPKRKKGANTTAAPKRQQPQSLTEFSLPQDYAHLSPQEKEDLTQKMTVATKSAIANMFRGTGLGV